MSWIREEATSSAPIIRVMSIDSESMRAVSGMGRAVTFGASALTRVQEEAIATSVSAANQCRY